MPRFCLWTLSPEFVGEHAGFWNTCRPPLRRPNDAMHWSGAPPLPAESNNYARKPRFHGIIAKRSAGMCAPHPAALSRPCLPRRHAQRSASAGQHSHSLTPLVALRLTLIPKHHAQRQCAANERRMPTLHVFPPCSYHQAHITFNHKLMPPMPLAGSMCQIRIRAKSRVS